MKKAFLFLFFFIQTIYSQEILISSLELQLKNEKLELKKLEILNEMVAVSFADNIQQALHFSKQGVALAEKIKEVNWQPKFYEMQGRMHANMLQLDSATLFFKKAMNGYKVVNNKKGQATTFFKMAWISKKNGDYEKAMQNDLAALKLMEAVADNAGICDALTRISEDLTHQNKLKEALEYAQKATAIAEKYNLISEKFYTNINAGNVAMASNKYQKSLDYYRIAEKIAVKENIGLVSICDVTNSIGNALKRLGKHKEALQYYQKNLKLAKEINYPNAISSTIANLGEVNLLLGNYNIALPYQLETVRMQEQNKDVSNLVEAYHHVSTIYNKLGDYKAALAYKQKAYTMRDSVASIESDAKMSELLTKYETKKKEETIANQDAKISQQKLVQILSLGLVLVLIGLLIFGYISYRNRNKSNQLLAIKNAENELLLKEIHHRVKNNLEVVSSLLALQSAQIDDPNTKYAMAESQNRVNSIGIVHQKLYQGTNLGAVEMKDYFLNLSESIFESFGAEQRIDLKLAMENLDLDIDTAVPLGLIVNELLTNCIKYAFPEEENGTITIKLHKNNNMLRLEVADNGVGKSGIVHGTGFGGQLVSLLTQQLNGTMTEVNQNGTKLVFDFKLNKAA